MADLQPEDALRLLRVMQEISFARDLDRVTTIVKHAARELSGADGVTFVLKDGDQCYYVDEDAISPLWKGKRFPLTACISGWAMLHGENAVIEDIYQDDRIPHDAYRPTFVKSLAMIPVRSSDPIAALGAYWAKRHRATSREVELLQSLADTTAVAIDNVQLINALERRVEESARLLEQFKKEVAKREELEKRFHQSQKLKALGQLAGGVAHDFNNLLTVISGNCSLALSRAQEDDELRQELNEINKAADHASSLTRQLLAFGRRQVIQPRVLDLNEIVVRMDKMLRRLIGEDIDLSTRLEPDLDPVLFDPGKIEQIVMNLAVNARDAMPDGGKLTLETANVTLDERYADDHPDAKPGPHVMLAMSDTGEGMDAETRNRIFEPFFTTKKLGKGTGLGLATVHGIVKQGGGTIWVYSEPGEGTTFKIYLPRTEKALDSVEPSPEKEKQPHTGQEKKSHTGRETILVVEDEEGVRRLLQTVLERSGYTVHVAGNAEEAIRLAEEQEAIDLLLTDVILPDRKGPDVADKLTERFPNISVAYMSGYTDNAIAHQGVLEAGTIFIEKPITPAPFLEHVREALEGPSRKA